MAPEKPKPDSSKKSEKTDLSGPFTYVDLQSDRWRATYKGKEIAIGTEAEIRAKVKELGIPETEIIDLAQVIDLGGYDLDRLGVEED